MGGQRIDKTKVRAVIASQERTFEYGDIANQSDISTASALNIIKEMLAEGGVYVDHKVGKRKFYAVSAAAASNGGKATGIAKKNITSLPPEERFEYVGMLVDMVAEGLSPSALITGVAGIGKTYLVKDRLKNQGMVEGIDYQLTSGHATPQGLYKHLHDHRTQNIVFDDCDSVFKYPESINLLKGALDSYDVRRVSWLSGRLPDDLEPSFDFEGSIIFVSNLTADRIDEAVKSRTFVVDLQMSRKEICAYLHTIADKIEPDMALATKQMIIDELSIIADGFEQFNVRTFIKACRMYRKAIKEQRDWKDMMQVII